MHVCMKGGKIEYPDPLKDAEYRFGSMPPAHDHLK